MWDVMSDCAPTYRELRDQVVDGVELSDEQLKYFVSTFQWVINSRRRSSYIKNFEDLITLLEKRDYIGEANVGPLEQIVNLLPDSGILKEVIYDFQRYRDGTRFHGPCVSRGKIISATTVVIRNELLSNS